MGDTKKGKPVRQTRDELVQEIISDNARDRDKRESGGSTSYYSFPECSETKDIIRYKKMTHPEGEIMCALMRLHDNGEYKRNLEKIIFYAKSELEYYNGMK